jgi:hypothetical protein
VSLLDDIIKGATDSSKSDLATVLRQCLILADSLDHPGFNEWVEHELNGYPPGVEPPPYRALTGVRSIGDFFGVAGSQMRNVPLPTVNVPEPLRKRISAATFRQGVGAIEALVAGHDHDLQSPWPPDLIARVASRYFAGQTLMAAHIEVPRAAVIGVLDAIRNRVLKFALEIRKKAPRAGESSPGPALPKEQVGQIFNTYIMGGTQNVAVGSSNFSQTLQQVQAGDFASLRKHLEGLGVPSSDVTELDSAIRADGPPAHPDRFGGRVARWIGTMTGKAASGVWNVATSSAGQLLVDALRAYYDLPTS